MTSFIPVKTAPLLLSTLVRHCPPRALVSAFLSRLSRPLSSSSCSVTSLSLSPLPHIQSDTQIQLFHARRQAVTNTHAARCSHTALPPASSPTELCEQGFT